MDFTIPADQEVKLKENEKRGKYLDLAGELKKQWNMFVVLISIIDGSLGTISRKLENVPGQLEIHRRIETLQTIALLRLARILEELWRKAEIWFYLVSKEVQQQVQLWKLTKSKIDVKNNPLNSGLYYPLSKIERKWKKDKYLDLARELKTMEYEHDSYTNCNWCTWNNTPRIGKKTGRVGNKRTREHITAVLRLTRILRRVLETWGDLLSLKLCWKTIS